MEQITSLTRRCNALGALQDGLLGSDDVDQPRLRRVVDLNLESGVRFERFEVFGTGFFDESDLSQVRLGQSRRFPLWWQRTGSAVLDCSEGGSRLGGPRAVTPVEKTPPAHGEPRPTNTSGLLPSRWKTVGWVRSSLGQVQFVEKPRR